MPETVAEFVFEGGTADEHQLDIYDAARFQYGVARLVYTAELFRQTGRVPLRIQRGAIKGADYRVSAPRPGSYLHQIVAIAAPAIADVAIKVPIQVMIAHALGLIFPPRKQAIEVILEIEHERTRQVEAREQTAQRIAELNARTNADLIGILKTERGLGTVPVESLPKVERAVSNLEAAVGRDELFSAHREALNEIPPDQNARFATKARTQMAEAAYPLKRSANRLQVSPLEESDRKIATLTLADLVALEGHQMDEQVRNLAGSIKSYDKETGWGKWRGPDFPDPISFLVRAQDRRTVTQALLEEMMERETSVNFFVVRDSAGHPKYLVFDSLHAED